MSIYPTRWIAGTGKVTPVVILETGTGEHKLSFVPPDPVVVRSVEDYLEFVASESCLFKDRGLAVLEARRLRSEKVSQLSKAIFALERKEILSTRGTCLSTSRVDSGSLIGEPVLKLGTDSIESSETPVEDVVKNNQEEDAKPTTLLDRVSYVIGRGTISFDELCNRLKNRDWMPKRRSSVSNILSAHKNLFNCPARSMYSLRSKPKVSSIEDEPTSEESESSSEELSTDSVELDQVLQDPDDEGSLEVSADEEGTEVAAADPEVEPSEFSTWMGKPMRSLNSNHAHYRDDDESKILLSEKKNGSGDWRAEIYITGLEMWYSGVSDDRSQARDRAEANLRNRIQSINEIISELGI
jgi:hypothetical protein